MDSKELSQRFEKLAERLQTVVTSLEEYTRGQELTEKTASTRGTYNTGSDLGTLSTLPGKSTNPFLDFILS